MRVALSLQLLKGGVLFMCARISSGVVFLVIIALNPISAGATTISGCEQATAGIGQGSRSPYAEPSPPGTPSFFAIRNERIRRQIDYYLGGGSMAGRAKAKILEELVALKLQLLELEADEGSSHSGSWSDAAVDPKKGAYGPTQLRAHIETILSWIPAELIEEADHKVAKMLRTQQATARPAPKNGKPKAR